VNQREHIAALCKAIAEMSREAPHDLCGEHRQFYGQRLGDAFGAVGHLFPAAMAKALTDAGMTKEVKR
jgi:hypothetical protein